MTSGVNNKNKDLFSLTQEDFAHALDQLSDGILIVHRDRGILFCNKAASRIYGLSKAEIAGSHCYDLVEKGVVDRCFADLSLNTKKAITYEQFTKSGKALVNTVCPVPDPQGEIRLLLEQVRNLKSLEFYAPDCPLAQPAEKSSGLSDQGALSQKAPAPLEFKSAAMQNVYKLADNMAPKNINILILGASGTGKSHLARRIHENSARKRGPFVTINCAAIPETLIESELFGYLKGAFSGASSKGKQGLIETAKGGTLFLDEIGELPLSLQSKLLQFVQEKTYTPIGGVQPIHIDTRIIAATNRDIPSLIGGGSFREDLYYRLATVTILLPPLKDRPDDTRLLLKYFCNVFSLKHENSVSFSTRALELLCRYSWPGNIREIEHLVEFLVLSCHSGYITPDMLPAAICTEGQKDGGKIQPSFPLPDFPGAISSNASASASTVPAPAVSMNPDSSASTVPAKAVPANVASAAPDFSQVESLEGFLRSQEEALIQALYPSYSTSYKLSERLKISQSTASRLIRKHIKK